MTMRTPLRSLLGACALCLTAAAQPTDDVSAAPSVPPVDTEVAPVESPAVTEPAPPAPSVVIADEVTATTVARERDTLSVDFPDEEIRNILRNVADLFELNLVIPDTLQGNTSIKLRDVTWRQIFEVVLSPVGFTFIEEGNIIKVVSQETLLQEPTSTDVFVINYARAEDLRGSIEPLIDSAVGGRIVVNARSNALIITERPSRLSRIRPIIEQLDKATDQVMIESKFVEVTDSNVKNIGVNWSSLQGYRVGVGQIEREYTAERGNLRSNESINDRITNNQSINESVGQTVNGTTSTSGNTSNTSSTISSTPTGVAATNTSTVASNLGSTTTSSTTQTDNVTGLNDITDTISNLNSLLATGGTTRMTSAVFSADEFGVILSALREQSDTKLVSNPTVVTLNNTEAQINVGAEYPIPAYTYNAERGTFEVSGFEYRPVGIILKVTPQVNAQGFIKLTIEPEVSSQTGFVNFGGAGAAEIPIIATRRARTQVSLRDGYTMGIGGLIETDTQKGQTKVPILGDIPGLGRLFKSDSLDDSYRNLLIFITARTVSADGAEIGEVFDPRVIRRMNLKREDLPGYRDGSDPFGPEPTETNN